jgi:hypothetical protein
MDRKAFGNAAGRLPETAREAESAMRRLWEFEGQRCGSMDKTADTFARMLSSLGAACSGDKERVARRLLYHLGRWIYLMDACDDLAGDCKKGRYNPVAARLKVTELSPETIELMEKTLSFSQKGVLNALALWPEGPLTPVLQNIVCDGLTRRTKMVFHRKENANERP